MFKDNVFLPNGKKFAFWESQPSFTRELHVNQRHPRASDDNDGSEGSPFLTIDRAAQLAVPGTRVLVHPGLYRETVRPRMGGESPENIISYEAAATEGKVTISGSVIAETIVESVDWRRIGNAKIWAVPLNPEDFKGYNPFCVNNLIHSREWLDLTRENRANHLSRRGVVFIDGRPLRQVEEYWEMEDTPGTYYVEGNGMTIHFRPCDDADPAGHLIELTSREQNFVPAEPYMGYIRVKGFHFTHAATGHPVPQRGSISTWRGHHWVIEDNVIEWSNSVGIDVGNEDWSAEVREDIPRGATVLRGNDVRSCGVCGIVGINAMNMLVEDNRITDCGWLMTWHCSESGGIKFHDAVNCLIRRNIVEKLHCGDAIWLDCGNVNNRISQNLVLNNESPDPRIIHIECTRDFENLVDNNIIWNCRATTPAPRYDVLNEREEESMQGAIMGLGTDRLWAVNNLIGKCTVGLNLNAVPFRMGFGRGGTARDSHVLNNVFYCCRDAAIRFENVENESDGNAFAKMPDGYLRLHYPLPEKLLHLSAWQEFYQLDENGVEAEFDIEVDEECYTLRFVPMVPMKKSFFSSGPRRPAKKAVAVGVENLERVKTIAMADVDYLGNARSVMTTPGPFEEPREGITINIDPRKKRTGA